MNKIKYIVSVLAIGVIGMTGFAQESQTGHSHEQAMMHDGTVVMTKQHHFELVPMMHGLAVFAYDYNQKPINVENAQGEATVILKSGEEHSFTLKSHTMMENEAMDQVMDEGQMGMSDDQHMDDEHGEMMEYPEEMENSMLWGTFDLSKLEGEKVKVSVKISGLSSEKESSVQFRETINLSNLRKQMETGHDEMNQNDRHMEDDGHMPD